MNPIRRQHQAEVETYLRETFGGEGWAFTLPRGSGHETYIAHGANNAMFVKVGARIEPTLTMARLGLAPPVLAATILNDSHTVLVQQFVDGRHPTRSDYSRRLEDVARIIRETHHNPVVQSALPPAPTDDYASAGRRALEQVQARWREVRAQVTAVVGFVDGALEQLEKRIATLSGGGLVASHNDICWDNWLFTPEGHIYLLDLDAMALDDPALDMGATLWWYYPQELWSLFLTCAGYPDDEAFRDRMWTRLALHCLSITLPRPGSFDRFDPDAYPGALTDFRAALGREGNPELP